MGKKERDVFSVANDKVKAVKAYIGQNIVSLIALLSMLIIFVFVSAMDFTNMKVDWSRVSGRQFWIDFALLVALGLLMFIVAVVYGKSKQKKTAKIMDAKEALFILKNYLTDNCLRGEFLTFLDKKNKDCKLQSYKDRMHSIAYFAPMKYRGKYNDLADAATLDNLESLHFRYKYPYSEALIFDNVPSRKSAEIKVMHTGYEKVTSWLMPTLMFMLFFQVIFLSAVFSEKTTTIDTWIHLIAKVWTMLLFALRGVSYGVYSIEDELYSVLENRKGLVTEFLAEKKINVLIKDNESYKFKVVEVKPEDLAVNQREVTNGKQL